MPEKKRMSMRVWLVISALMGALADKALDIILSAETFSLGYWIGVFITVFTLFIIVYFVEKVFPLPESLL